MMGPAAQCKPFWMWYDVVWFGASSSEYAPFFLKPLKTHVMRVYIHIYIYVYIYMYIYIYMYTGVFVCVWFGGGKQLAARLMPRKQPTFVLAKSGAKLPTTPREKSKLAR